MREKQHIRESVRRWSEALFQKLVTPRNSCKPDWRGQASSLHLRRLLEEVGELIDAPPEEVPQECADVQAFAGMLSDTITLGDRLPELSEIRMIRQGSGRWRISIK